MTKNENCIFCKIVSGEAPSHKIWEDELHLAFLSIFPNTEGFSVVVAKEHLPSYIFDLDDDQITTLMLAAKKVAKRIDAKMSDVGRTGVIFEGFGVDHIHAKLFPMHGTKTETWVQRKSNVDKFFTQYEGYVSSHDYARADDTDLAKLAEKLRS